MSANRVTWLLVTRSLRRHRSRTLTLVLVLTIPLAIACGLSVLYSTADFSTERGVSEIAGRSQTVLTNGDFTAERGLVRALAEGPDAIGRALGHPLAVAPEVVGDLPASAQGRQVASAGFGLDLSAPVHQGRFLLERGRAATAAGEVVLSREVAKRLGVGAGFAVTLGQSSTPMEVTGIAVAATDTTRQFVITSPEQAAQLIVTPSPSITQPVLPGKQQIGLINWHTEERVSDARDWSIVTREQLTTHYRAQAEGEDAGAVPSIVGAAILVFAELGLILGAVYAITVRSGRRELALLAVAGAGPGTRRAVITGQGLLTGVIATVLGLVLGVLGAWALVPFAQQSAHQVWQPLTLQPLLLITVLVLGIGTPALAARIAARGVRTDVVAAVRGLPDEIRSTRRGYAAVAGWGVAGVLMLLAGSSFGSIPLVLLGALTLVIASALLVRAVLPGTANGGRGWRLLPRMGMRLAGQAPARAATLGVVIASLTLIGGLALTAMAGLTDQVRANYVAASPPGSAFVLTTKYPRPGTLAQVSQALANRPVAALGIASPPPPAGAPQTYWGHFSVRTPLTECLTEPASTPEKCRQRTGFRAGPDNRVVVADESALQLVLGKELTSAQRAAFAAGSMLVTDRRVAPSGQSTVEVSGQQEKRSVPAVVIAETAPYSQIPVAFLSPAGLAKLGGVIQPTTAYFYVPAPDQGAFSAEQEDEARAALTADIGAGFAQFQVERGPAAAEVYQTATLALAILLILVAGTMAYVVVTLAVQEIRPDLSAMAAAGAERRFRSWLAGSHAAIVTALGLVVGLLVTAVSAPALLSVLHVGWTPWPWVGLIAIAVVAVAVATFAGRVAGSRVGTVLRAES
ncbi:FtsX-like permease family protein [Pseudonocardiaceae bacterium YIM PH 21723]|nr:FtsX-like permease family protein [Pseudonocardiaceae bacterium YIM PH 21723]